MFVIVLHVLYFRDRRNLLIYGPFIFEAWPGLLGHIRPLIHNGSATPVSQAGEAEFLVNSEKI